MQLKTIEDVPLYNTTLAVLKFWSFLLRHDWRRYVCMTPYFMINVAQFLDFFYSKDAISNIIRNSYITVLFFNTILRAVMMCIDRFKYEKYMDNLRILYIEMMNSDDEYVRRELAKTTKLARILSIVNLILGCSTCFCFCIYPVFASTRVLPFGMYIPVIDKYADPYYEIFYIIQVIMSPMGCCMYIPFTNLVVSFLMFAIQMCQVLQHKLRNLKNVSPERAKKEIIWCIKYQLTLSNFIDELNRLTTYIYLVEFLLFGLMLCVMLFLFIIVETFAEQVIVVCYIMMIIVQSSVLYYFANELYDQSLDVAVAAYDSNWFEFDVQTQKMLKLFILRAQRPCAILVGNVYPMNLELLQSLLNATYSYFTLLKRVYG